MDAMAIPFMFFSFDTLIDQTIKLSSVLSVLRAPIVHWISRPSEDSWAAMVHPTKVQFSIGNTSEPTMDSQGTC